MYILTWITMSPALETTEIATLRRCFVFSLVCLMCSTHLCPVCPLSVGLPLLVTWIMWFWVRFWLNGLLPCAWESHLLEVLGWGFFCFVLFLLYMANLLPRIKLNMVFVSMGFPFWSCPVRCPCVPHPPTVSYVYWELRRWLGVEEVICVLPTLLWSLFVPKLCCHSIDSWLIGSCSKV